MSRRLGREGLPRSAAWAGSTWAGSGWAGSAGLALALAACVAAPPEPDPAAPAAAPAHAAPSRLTLPAMNPRFAAFAATSAGSSAEAGLSLRVSAGVGSAEAGGRHFAVALPYGVHTGGFDVAGGFAVAPDQLRALWLVCRDGQLRYLWQVDCAGGALQLHPASGSCTTSYLPAAQSATLPVLDLAAPTPQVGFAIDGADVHLGAGRADGTSGVLRIDGSWWPAWVYASVDCSGCGQGGWHELHLLAYRAAPPRLLSAIAYVRADAPGEVTFGRAVELPTLASRPAWRVAAHVALPRP